MGAEIIDTDSLTASELILVMFISLVLWSGVMNKPPLIQVIGTKGITKARESCLFCVSSLENETIAHIFSED